MDHLHRNATKSKLEQIKQRDYENNGSRRKCSRKKQKIIK